MDANNQQDVSPATAGGAPAPGHWRVGNRNPRNLYWTTGKTDEHRGVVFDPADGPWFVEALNARLRAVEDEFLSRKPSGTDPRDTEIARLCGEFRGWREKVQAVEADLERANNNAIRASHECGEIRHRVAVELNRKPSENAGVPTIDLIDDLVGRWRTAVTHLRRIEADLDEARSTIGRVCAERHDEHAELCAALNLDTANATWASLRLGIVEVVTERNRLRAKLDQHLADENSAQAANDRLRDELDLVRRQYQRAVNTNNDLVAERDRLRIALDIADGYRPKFQPGQYVRIGSCEGMVVKPKDVTRVQLLGMLQEVDYPTGAVKAISDDEEVPF
jgi:hypothetical protein